MVFTVTWSNALVLLVSVAIVLRLTYRLGWLFGWDQGMQDCSWIWGQSKEETMAEARRQGRWPETRKTVHSRLKNSQE